jgi:putative phosphoesterase
MIVGILSDTHDHMTNIRRAVDIFHDRKVEHVIHAGDFTSPFTFRLLNDLRCGFTGIFGNNDGDKLLLQKMSGGKIFAQPHELLLGGKKIMMIHEHFIADALADSGHYDVVVYGHTHKPDIRKGRSGALVVNPGETGAWLYGKASVAVLDLTRLEAEIIGL